MQTESFVLTASPRNQQLMGGAMYLTQWQRFRAPSSIRGEVRQGTARVSLASILRSASR